MPSPGVKKIYCEPGALTREIRNLGKLENVVFVHFPYDPDSHTRLTRSATPSSARICDLNLRIRDLPGTIEEYSGSTHLAEILTILGRQNRRDVLHVDSAFTEGCFAFVTPDRGHILRHKTALERLLGIRFFHPSEYGVLEKIILDSKEAPK